MSDKSPAPENPGTVAIDTRHDRFSWYAVHTQTGMEKKAKAVLEERIKKMKLDQYFGQIIIPIQMIEKIDTNGKKKFVEQKMMPGYIFVQMEMAETAYSCVRDTPKITNFIGTQVNKHPPALTPEEVDKVVNRAAHVAREIAARPKLAFEKGDRVKVIDGPFTNFVGDVDEVRPEKQKLKLLISVFGRPTPVDIEFAKVEKVGAEG